MKAAILLLGTKIVDSVFKFLKSTAGKIITVSGIFYVFLLLIPFEIGLPSEIMEILTGDFFKNLMLSITFLFPVGFAFSCLVVIFIAKHTSILTGVVKMVYKLIKGGGSSEN